MRIQNREKTNFAISISYLDYYGVVTSQKKNK